MPGQSAGPPPCAIGTEIRVLAATGVRHGASGERLRALAAAGIDWTRLLAAADRHRMVPLLHAAATDGNLGDVPDEAYETLAAGARADRARSAQLMQETERLLARFERAAIPLFVLKGVALSVRLYGDPALRHCRDIDLLVRQADRDAACALLVEDGYQQAGCPVPPTSLGRWFLDHHAREIPLIHSVRGTCVDLRWRLHQRDACATEAFFVAPRPTAADPRWQLPPSAEAVNLLAHGAGHGWSRLKWLTDLVQAWTCYDVDWAAWCNAVHRAGLGRALGSALRLVGWIFPDHFVPDAIARCAPHRGGQLLARFAARDIAAGRPLLPSRNPLRLLGNQCVLLSAATPAERRRTLRTALLCADDIQMISLPRWAWPAYPPLKPLWWSIRRTRELLANGPARREAPSTAAVVDSEAIDGGSFDLFGMHVTSDFGLPLERVECTCAATLRIRERECGQLPSSAPGVSHLPGGACRIRVPAAGDIVISADGTMVDVAPARGARAGDLAAYLLGSAIGAVLWRRGWVPLHASAVRFGGRVLLIAGPSGVGKSTFAAACLAAGGAFVSDDVTPLALAPDGRLIMAGAAPRRMRLWPDAIGAFAPLAQVRGLVEPGIEKRLIEVASPPADSDGALTLLCIEADAPTTVEELRGGAALSALTANLYRPDLISPDGRAAALAPTVAVCRLLPMVRVRRPRDLRGVAALARLAAEGWPQAAAP
jgi:hypothetical protein